VGVIVGIDVGGSTTKIIGFKNATAPNNSLKKISNRQPDAAF